MQKIEQQPQSVSLSWQWEVRNMYRNRPLGDKGVEGTISLIDQLGKELLPDNPERNRLTSLALENASSLRNGMCKWIERVGEDRAIVEVTKVTDNWIKESSKRTEERISADKIAEAQAMIKDVAGRLIPLLHLKTDDGPQRNNLTDRRESVRGLIESTFSRMFSPQLVTPEGIGLRIDRTPQDKGENRTNFKLSNLLEEQIEVTKWASLIGAMVLGVVSVSTSSIGFMDQGGDGLFGIPLSLGVSAIELVGVGALKREIDSARADNRISPEEGFLIFITASTILGAFAFDYVTTYDGIGVRSVPLRVFFTVLVSHGFEFCVNQFVKACKMEKGA